MAASIEAAIVGDREIEALLTLGAMAAGRKALSADDLSAMAHAAAAAMGTSTSNGTSNGTGSGILRTHSAENLGATALQQHQAQQQHHQQQQQQQSKFAVAISSLSGATAADGGPLTPTTANAAAAVAGLSHALPLGTAQAASEFVQQGRVK
jgi:hypothetical protein